MPRFDAKQWFNTKITDQIYKTLTITHHLPFVIHHLTIGHLFLVHFHFIFYQISPSSAAGFMINQIITTINEYLNSFIDVLLTSSLLELLEIAIFIFFLTTSFWLFSHLVVYLFNLLIFLSKFALKLLQVIILVLLLITSINLILDPNRSCQVKYEDYVTRCQPSN